ncbi:glycosyltransferase [Algoriphagus halophytocola]|uniref:Glycosyltransferase n=1 Tax=Algoriphagus halophytocola TaxID=2991499 RepID=A0ABY6MGX8_9BACT|nr:MULTISPECIES: glycosyltransferase [unclassified Algoriphagus]UZD23046.1 glycosyltransferase [Algoriphagus sp. TR-M5]WBL44338.1 glycosyltransferase [Algoriphagus sp. TR-M9]
MRKILIISPSFAPQSFVGGVRTTMFAKYLTLIGWEVWVITRVIPTDDQVMNSGMKVHLPFALEKRIIRINNPSESEYIKTRNWRYRIRDFFFPEYSSPPGFLDLAIPIGRNLVKSHNFDIILASVPDQWGVTLGQKLAQKSSSKFVVDFRDIYEQEKSEPRTAQEKLHIWRMLWRRNITNRSSDLNITVSQFHRKTLENKLGKRAEVIYNGYDDEIFIPLQSQRSASRFTISYLGRILSKWYHNPAIFFEALNELKREGLLSENELQINFYGVNPKKLSDYITSENKEFLHFLPRVETSEVPKIINDSQALLLITNQGREGVLTTKFFEYAGVQKPILCVPGDGSELDSMIRSENFGVCIDSVQAMKKYLMDSINKWKSGVWPSHLDTQPEFYTRKNQAVILSDLLTSLVQ